jgi:tetratricopeptide (TPR) repeat protein
MRPVLLLALGAIAFAQSTDDLLFRARHAQIAQGDPQKALELYTKALRDKSLSAARQAKVHLRIAECWIELRDDERALGHLKKHTYEHEDVDLAVRARASRLRYEIEERLPGPAPPPSVPGEDQAAARARLVKKQLGLARTALEGRNDLTAFYFVQTALSIDPDHAEARALAAELENRLSGVMDIVRDPLKWFRTLNEARIRTVARHSAALLREALTQARKGEFNLAEDSFKRAVEVIDACEFAAESDRLAALRQRVVEHWRRVRADYLGEERADPDLPRARRRSTPMADYLNVLQRVLDLVSGPDREYRIVPIAGRRAPTGSAAVTSPDHLALFRHIESSWTPALFARRYLPLHVHPDSWREVGNFLEAAGTMLIAHNRPEVLDALQKEVRRIEKPGPPSMRTRFVLASVPASGLARLSARYGKLTTSRGGDSPLVFRSLPSSVPLEALCDHLREGGADVKFERDLFDVIVSNGAAQTLFAGVRLKKTRADAPVLASHAGLLLDLFPLRERDGRTALALRLEARLPAPALPGAPARFLTQRGELFADVEPGGTLVVGGLIDPLARGEEDRTLLLLWENAAAPAGTTDTTPPAAGVELSMQSLLFDVLDRPGPRSDKQRGFLDKPDRLEALAVRARFLETLLKERLQSSEVRVDPEQAVVRVSPALREDAERAVEELEHESRRTYVVRIHVRPVLTAVFQRWLEREEIRLSEFGRARAAVREVSSGEFLLRNLFPARTEGDLYSSRLRWPAMPVLGLQARHVVRTRTRTSPAYATDEELATGETRTIVEGLRVTVRPFTFGGNRLRAWIEVETAGLQTEKEELVLGQAIPSYQTFVEGILTSGVIDFGNPAQPRTALICSIPHPTASTTEALTELVLTVSIRALP